MDTRQPDLRTETTDQALLTWSKPELRRLEISSDTLAEPRQPLKIGSQEDAFFGTGFPAGA